MKSGTIEYPAYINSVSVIVGKLRDLVNSEMNEKAARFKRGDRSEQVNILGVRGELIALHCIHTATGKRCGFADLLSPRPLGVPDITLGDKKYDVKTIRSDAPDLLVNKEAHAKTKGITHYWFIQPTGEGQARYWVFEYGEVSQWPTKNCHYSDAHYKPLASL